MSFDADKLAQLLPGVVRIRDAEQHGPLAALLEVIADQVGIVEDDLAQLYADQFVETAAPWVLPYLGDLLGISGLPGAPLNARAEVAHTIAYRRRKGTAAMLEQLARDVTGLAARADESFELLAASQSLVHLRPRAKGFLGLRDALRLEHLGSPFERLDGHDSICHTVDVRRIARARGRYNIPDVALFLWRQRAHSLTRSPGVPDAGDPAHRFRFSPLGADAPLFNRPRTEDVLTHLAEPLDVPGAITRRAMNATPAEYYGADRSVLVERAPGSPGVDPDPVLEPDIAICDLSAWTGPTGKVALDPVLGRIVFADGQTRPPLVTFHYGFAGNLGGGEYERAPAGGRADVRVAQNDPAAIGDLPAALAALGPGESVVEIADSGRYAGPPAIAAANRRITLRARSGARPTLVLSGDLNVDGGPQDAVTLDGLLIVGGAVTVGTGLLGRLELRHCTLVPAAAAALTVAAAGTDVEVDHCILGAIRAHMDSRVRLTATILDATDETLVAYADPADTGFGAPLRADGATVLGRVKADVLEEVSNSILLAGVPAADAATWPGPVLARRRQEGCVRFSYVPPGSQTPRRYRCQPIDDTNAPRVRPILVSPRHGTPGYAQLSDRTAAEIRTGADDDSELGAFHDLQLPRREAHLRARLDEYLRFGLEAGVLHAT
jgi:hypothetical protein